MSGKKWNCRNGCKLNSIQRVEYVRYFEHLPSTVSDEFIEDLKKDLEWVEICYSCPVCDEELDLERDFR